MGKTNDAGATRREEHIAVGQLQLRQSLPLGGLRFDLAGLRQPASSACLRAFDAVQAPIVLLIAADILLSPQALKEHVEMHRLHPEEEVAVFGRTEISPELQTVFFANLTASAAVNCRLQGAALPPGDRNPVLLARAIFPQRPGILRLFREHQVGLQSFRSMRRMEARRRKASALRLRHSQSFASLRQRPSQASVRSTIQRLGKTTKPLT